MNLFHNKVIKCDNYEQIYKLAELAKSEGLNVQGISTEYGLYFGLNFTKNYYSNWTYPAYKETPVVSYESFINNHHEVDYMRNYVHVMD